MEQYGRPTRKKTSAPVVAFLHPASSKPSTIHFDRPLQKPRTPNHQQLKHDDRNVVTSAIPTEETTVVHKVRPSTASAVKASSLQFAKQSSAELNGDARPDIIMTPHTPQSTLKMRPRTASAIKINKSSNNNEDNSIPKETVQDDSHDMSLVYIRRLKDDIQCVYRQLSQEDQNKPTKSLPSELLTTSLTVDNDEKQRITKRLEEILRDGLILLMDQTFCFDSDSIEPCVGYGFDSGSIYLRSFMSLTRRAEALKKKSIVEESEREFLENQMKLKQNELLSANEQILLFQDTLAKISNGKTNNWTLLRSEFQKGTFLNEKKNEQVAQLEEINETIKTQLEEKTNQYEHIEKEFQTLLATNTELNLQLDVSKKQTDALQEELERNREIILNLEKSIQVLNEEVTIASKKNQTLECDLQAAKAMVKKTQAELKSKLHQLNDSVKAKIDAAVSLARQQMALEWESKLAEERLAQQLTQQAQTTSHLTEMSSLQTSLTEEKQSLERERHRVLDQHKLTLHELSFARDEAESVKANHHLLSSQWTEKLDLKTKTIETIQKQLQEHEATILQLKLATSEAKITVRHEMELTWLQKVAALEHDVAQAGAQLEAEREKFKLDLLTERERVKHIMAQSKSISDELETANLCLAERKRQRENELEAFEAREQRASQTISQLTDEISRLQKELLGTKKAFNINDMEEECKQLHKHNNDLVKQMNTLKERMKKDENESKQINEKVQELQLVVALFEANKSDLLNTIQLLKCKNEQLENKTKQTLDKNIRKTNIEEINEQKCLKKQQMDLDIETQQLMEDKQLLKQVVHCINERLTLQLQLLTNIPKETKDEWIDMHTQWQHVQENCDDIDWQLIHMKKRLDEMDLNKITKKNKIKKKSPFSDAIAAGQRTIGVVNQLHQEQHDHDTYASALTTEMKLMKDSYEIKLQELNTEIKRLLSLRNEQTTKIQNEHAEERMKLAAIINQLQEKYDALETSMDSIMNERRKEKDEEVDLICKYRVERDPKSRNACLESLLECRALACSEEVKRRSEYHEKKLRDR